MTIQNGPKAPEFQQVLLPPHRKTAMGPMQELYLPGTLKYIVLIFKEAAGFR